jgi:hypothetical protein
MQVSLKCVSGACVCVSQLDQLIPPPPTTTKYAKVSGQNFNILLQICIHGEFNILE